MSTHLMGLVRHVKASPVAKLVLVGLCDSATDNDLRTSWPGSEWLVEWSGVSRARMFEGIEELLRTGLILKTKKGHKGQRAEFVVFPQGCCAAHGPSNGSTRLDAKRASKGPAEQTLCGSKASRSTAQSVQNLPSKGPAEQTPSLRTSSLKPSSAVRGAVLATDDEQQVAKNLAGLAAVRAVLEARQASKEIA